MSWAAVTWTATYWRTSRSQAPPGGGVFQRYYSDLGTPLVLLTIDTDRLGVPWREDDVGGETYPHIYGPLSPRAVVDVQPLNKHGGTSRPAP